MAIAAGLRRFWSALRAVTGDDAYERYLGLQAIVATAGFDAGELTAWLSPDPTGFKKHADATN